MTPQQEAELVRRLRSAYNAFNRGDFDAATQFADPDVEYVPAGAQPPVRGIDQLRAWMEPSAFESQVIEPVEVTVRGNKLLTLLHSTARGARSGIEIEIDTWAVMTLNDDGLVTRIQTFLRHEEQEARQAAGLGSPTAGAQ